MRLAGLIIGLERDRFEITLGESFVAHLVPANGSDDLLFKPDFHHLVNIFDGFLLRVLFLVKAVIFIGLHILHKLEQVVIFHLIGVYMASFVKRVEEIFAEFFVLLLFLLRDRASHFTGLELDVFHDVVGDRVGVCWIIRLQCFRRNVVEWLADELLEGRKTKVASGSGCHLNGITQSHGLILVLQNRWLLR